MLKISLAKTVQEESWTTNGLGPTEFQVHALGRGLYRLEDVKNPTKVVSRVNGIHLKQYLPPTLQVCMYFYICVHLYRVSSSTITLFNVD